MATLVTGAGRSIDRRRQILWIERYVNILGPLVMIMLLCLIMALADPRFFRIQNIMIILQDASIFMVLAIVGDNGAGKSTLIKVLTGVHQPDEGEIRLEGQPVAIANKRQSRALGIEAVYQNLGLVDTLDAAGNVFLGHELKRRILGIDFLDNARMGREAARVLKENVGIELEDITAPTIHLSGGQRQAVAIARAIYSTDLKILVMDEPTASLGPEETRNTIALMRRLKEQGIALILISHNLDHVFQVADRVAVMRGGRKVAELECASATKQDVLAHIVAAT